MNLLSGRHAWRRPRQVMVLSRCHRNELEEPRLGCLLLLPSRLRFVGETILTTRISGHAKHFDPRCSSMAVCFRTWRGHEGSSTTKGRRDGRTSYYRSVANEIRALADEKAAERITEQDAWPYCASFIDYDASLCLASRLYGTIIGDR